MANLLLFRWQRLKAARADGDPVEIDDARRELAKMAGLELADVAELADYQLWHKACDGPRRKR